MLRSQPHDSGVRFGTARMLRVTANIDRMVGLYEEALPLYQEATNILTALAADSPADLGIDEIRVEMAFNAIDTGENVRMKGQPAASQAYFQKAIDAIYARDLRPEEPAVNKRIRAVALLNLASAKNEIGQHEQAKADALRATELLAPLAGEGVDHAEESVLLVLAQDNLAIAERELGNRPEASRVLDLALARATALGAAFNSPDIKRVLATIQIDLGELLAGDATRLAEARAAFDMARRELLALARAYPHIPGIRRDLAAAFNGLGGTSIALCAQFARARSAESQAVPRKRHGELPERAKIPGRFAQVSRFTRLRKSIRTHACEPGEDCSRKKTVTRRGRSSTWPPLRTERRSQPTRRVRSTAGSSRKFPRSVIKSSEHALLGVVSMLAMVYFRPRVTVADLPARVNGVGYDGDRPDGYRWVLQSDCQQAGADQTEVTRSIGHQNESKKTLAA